MLGLRRFASSGESVGAVVVTREHTRFDAFKLAARGGELAGSVDPAALPRLAERVAEAGGRVAWRIRGGEDGQGRPALALTLEGAVPLACQRCLGTMLQGVAQQTTILLARDEAELVRLDEASESEVLLAGAPIEALGLVEDELLLSLPFAPRHEEGCGADAAASD